jgi:hypothetical protein
MSNGMGTQTGFCVLLNKPHYIFKQEVVQKSKSAKEEARHASRNNASVKDAVKKEREFFADLFSEFQDYISPEQYEATAEYWGFKALKTPAELRRFLSYRLLYRLFVKKPS